MKHKLKIFKMTAIPTPSCMRLNPANDVVQHLESWQHRCIKCMMNIRYSTHENVSNTELRKKTRFRTRHDLLREHNARAREERLPRRMLTGQLGKTRPRG